MTDFNEIIRLRNKGNTQEEIAKTLGVSRRSIIRYLKSGKIPVYQRPIESTRVGPFLNFQEMATEKINKHPKIPLNELYEYLFENGYTGSERTLRRQTRELRLSLKTKEIYFKREPLPAEIMEGDFTEFNIFIGGIKRKIYLWVSSLPYSNSYFATPFYNCSFESFAQGTCDAFDEFGGVAKKYRLDNLSPAVSKILMGKDRKVTTRYAQLQAHYGFAQDFCNPGKGNEKGNVEANNKYLKRKILAKISLNNLLFKDIESFKDFVWKICREHNEQEKVQEKFLQEKLAPLPASSFKCFRSEVVLINKYSLFNLGTTGHMYSVPSRFIGLSLEVRVYSSILEIVYQGEIICSHKRLYGPKGLVSIEIEHILNGLLKKPGAMKDWKYRKILFERPVWSNFYKKLNSSGGSDKEYLRCLKLILTHGRDLVTVAMDLCLEDGDLSAANLEKILTNEMENIMEMKPLNLELNHFDDLLKGKNGSES